MSSRVLDNVEFKAICESCGIEYDKIQSKLLEILRKMSIKFPCGTLPSQFESTRCIFAIEISCRLLNLTFNRQEFIKLSRLKENDYQRGLNLIKTALHLSWEKMSAIDLLAIRFGTTFKTCAQQLLERYIAKCNQQSTQLKSNPVDSAAFQAAAFFIILKQRKIAVDKVHLMQIAEIEKTSFMSACNDINKVLGLVIDNKTKNKPCLPDNATTLQSSLTLAEATTSSAPANLSTKSKPLGLNEYLRSTYKLPASKSGTISATRTDNCTAASSSNIRNNSETHESESIRIPSSSSCVHAVRSSAVESHTGHIRLPSATSSSSYHHQSNENVNPQSSSLSVSAADRGVVTANKRSYSSYSHPFPQTNHPSEISAGSRPKASVANTADNSQEKGGGVVTGSMPPNEVDEEIKKKRTDRELYLQIRQERLAKLR